MKKHSLRKSDPPPARVGAQRNIFQQLAAVPHAFWTVLFIAAPMLFVLYFAFTDVGEGEIPVCIREGEVQNEEHGGGDEQNRPESVGHGR